MVKDATGKRGIKMERDSLNLKKRDTKIKEIVDTWIDYFTDGLSTIIYIFNPSLVVIGGGVTKQGDYLLDRINKSLDGKLGENYKKKFKIRFVQLVTMLECLTEYLVSQKNFLCRLA